MPRLRDRALPDPQQTVARLSVWRINPLALRLTKKLALITQALLAKKAQQVVVLDMRKMPSISEYFVIASGTSDRQLQTMAEEIQRQLHASGYRLGHVEGTGHVVWVLLDCGDVIVHLFEPEARMFYSLERLWGDAPQLAISTDGT